MDKTRKCFRMLPKCYQKCARGTDRTVIFVYRYTASKNGCAVYIFDLKVALLKMCHRHHHIQQPCKDPSEPPAEVVPKPVRFYFSPKGGSAG